MWLFTVVDQATSLVVVVEAGVSAYEVADLLAKMHLEHTAQLRVGPGHAPLIATTVLHPKGLRGTSHTLTLHLFFCFTNLFNIYVLFISD